MSDTMYITVRYAGRVHDVVSHEATAILRVPTTIPEIVSASEEARLALLEGHPSVFNTRITVGCGFGFSQQTIVVIVAGEVYECIECGSEGHRSAYCPQKKAP